MKSKKWFCETMTPEHGNMCPILDEIEDLEKHKYKIEQIVVDNNIYKIFYSRPKRIGE